MAYEVKIYNSYVHMHYRSLETLSLGPIEVSKLRPTNNDVGSHAVKLQVDQTVVVKTGST